MGGDLIGSLDVKEGGLIGNCGVIKGVTVPVSSS